MKSISTTTTTTTSSIIDKSLEVCKKPLSNCDGLLQPDDSDSITSNFKAFAFRIYFFFILWRNLYTI